MEKGSPADAAGLEPGDLILEVNKEPVDSAEACLRALREAEDKALIRVSKAGGEARYVLLKRE